MFTATLTHEFDDINKNFVTLYEDLDDIEYAEEVEYDFHLDQETYELLFTVVVDNDFSYLIEEIIPANVNFV